MCKLYIMLRGCVYLWCCPGGEEEKEIGIVLGSGEIGWSCNASCELLLCRLSGHVRAPSLAGGRTGGNRRLQGTWSWRRRALLKEKVTRIHFSESVPYNAFALLSIFHDQDISVPCLYVRACLLPFSNHTHRLRFTNHHFSLLRTTGTTGFRSTRRIPF